MTVGDRQTPLPPVHEAWLPREHALHRPRHARRQTFALVCAAIFFATPLLSFSLGARPTEFENHALTPFPSLGQGWGFFTGLSQWATDHLVFREQAIHAADGMSRGLFGEPPALGRTGGQQGPIQSPPVDTVPKHYPTAIEGKDGWLYLGDEVASHCAPNQPLDTTLASLRRLRDGVEASGRKFVVVVAPDKATMVPEHLPDDYVGKDCHQKTVTEFWNRVAGEDYMLDLRAQLRDWGVRNGAPVYGPLDAHWSDEGAVTATRAVAEKLRAGISATWRVEPGANWKVPADLPPLIGRSGQTTGRHYELMPDGNRDQTRPMPSDFSTPLRLDTASGPGTYGLSVGLLGDSFTIRTLPYLTAAFRNMTVLHHATVAEDQGKAAGQMFAGSNVVVLEVAERSLVRGNVGAINPPALDTILQSLSR
ncbi:alginate O-acetyltransferase AlgX-related protein [Amycolatopsis anabasis]|uniref:alginate O-acetyltransferase AlgX-related protein n=1 Tax=Amycolatopsis anabasis TaxID=1840409 RepID=UPI00131E84C6|nr:hypothetical protein [Amycolatopsis anabasis]